MSYPNVCRICLSVNVQLFNIVNTPLQAMYEKVICNPLTRVYAAVCFQCTARLRSSCRLQQAAVQADRILTELVEQNVVITEAILDAVKPDLRLNTLSVTVLEDINIANDDDIIKIDEEVNMKREPGEGQIKVEGLKDDIEDIPNDHSDDDNIGSLTTADFKQESDSEDDIPLKSLSDMKDDAKNVQVKSKRRYNKDVKLDAIEIILSREQQMQELLDRSKSLNYLNSPYKCSLCYRGFVHPHSYENHKEKHSERSGHLECPICRLRYTARRQLAAHEATAHARRYACTSCPHRSHTKNQALDHEKWHNGHTYPCKLCGEKFSKPTSYLTHMRKAHASEHICAQCGHSFVGRHGLLMHVSKAHRGQKQKPPTSDPPEKRRCDDCDIQFLSMEALHCHLLTSVKHAQWNDTSPECRICGASVPPSTRRAHTRAHARALLPAAARSAPRSAPLTTLPCDQCDAKFNSRSRLQAHVKRVHLGIKYNKNIVCEVCGKKCTSNATFRYHQRRHTGERPHACATCGASFPARQQLRLHARAHSGERPYACALCPKRFTQRPALNRHCRVHTGVKPYECHLCSKSFSQSNSVKLHVNTVHLKLVPHKKRTKAPIAELAHETTSTSATRREMAPRLS